MGIIAKVNSGARLKTDLPKEVAKSPLMEAVAREGQAIISDSEYRSKHYKDDKKLLNEGIYYPQEYYKFLKEVNCTKRVEFLKKKGSFLHGYAPSSHFKMIEDPSLMTGKKGFNFVLKEGKSPADALRVIRKGPSLLGCGGVCQVAQYSAILEVLGDEKFNYIFGKEGKTPLVIGSPAYVKPLSELRERVKHNKKPERGNSVFFCNVPSYLSKHPVGASSGYHAICIGGDTDKDRKFIAHGLSSKGLTAEEISEQLRREFNLPFERWDGVPEKIEKRLNSFIESFFKKNPSPGELTKAEFKSQGGGVLRFDTELDQVGIGHLKRSSKEIARAWMPY